MSRSSMSVFSSVSASRPISQPMVCSLEFEHVLTMSTTASLSESASMFSLLPPVMSSSFVLLVPSSTNQQARRSVLGGFSAVWAVDSLEEAVFK